MLGKPFPGPSTTYITVPRIVTKQSTEKKKIPILYMLDFSAFSRVSPSRLKRTMRRTQKTLSIRFSALLWLLKIIL